MVKGVPHVKTVPLEVRESLSNSPSNSPKKSSYSGSDKSDSPSQRIAPPYKDPPAPPPYRDPPPPVNHDKYKKNILQDSNKPHSEKEHRNKLQESVLYNAQYRELIALINYQREKLSNQQADLTKVSPHCFKRTILTLGFSLMPKLCSGKAKNAKNKCSWSTFNKNWRRSRTQRKLTRNRFVFKLTFDINDTKKLSWPTLVKRAETNIIFV